MKVELPLPYTGKGKALMTMNVYRNMHHRSLSKFKREYGEICRNRLLKQTLPKFTRAKLLYILHTKPTKGTPTKKDPMKGVGPKNIDMTNILSIVDKVFLDELVKAEVIPDDTLRYVTNTKFESLPFSKDDYIEVLVEQD